MKRTDVNAPVLLLSGENGKEQKTANQVFANLMKMAWGTRELSTR